MKIEPYENLTLSENQLKVLRDLAERYDSWGEGAVSSFKTMAEELKMDVRHVRLACRALARKKLAEHVKGLVFQHGPSEGMLAGSGYACTALGNEVIERMEELERVRKELSENKTAEQHA